MEILEQFCTMGGILKWSRGTWVAQSVKHLILNFSSGHDSMVHEFEPHIGLCTDNMEPAWTSRSPPLSLPLPHSLSLKINKLIILLKWSRCWSACAAHLVKRPTLDVSSGHDLTVHELEPRVRLCTGSVEPAWDSLFIPLSLSLLCSLSFSLNNV